MGGSQDETIKLCNALTEDLKTLKAETYEKMTIADLTGLRERNSLRVYL